jgi:exopolyphosphatase/guanosine-5'-triphosphate,3'-diphosphate pyrophosphatase
VAVLLEFLKELRLPAVYYSRAGVRDGIIADLAARNVGAELSRLNREQRREVEEMSRRYGVSLEHARKVANISSMLFTALQPLHELPPASGKLLEAAAYLHDIGHFVSSVGHHKHSYYVVSNSDMPGFTERERVVIAMLCRYHRKSMPGPLHSVYQSLPANEKRVINMTIPILRLADNLDRSHEQRIQSVECRMRDGSVVLQVHSRGDIDLEQWGAERAGEAFRQIYNRPVTVEKARD